MSEDNDAQDAEIDRILEECKKKLMEHCQSVRIFVTYEKDDGSGDCVGLTEGQGNPYAIEGQVAAWLIAQREQIKIQEWDDAYDDPDADNEDGGEAGLPPIAPKEDA